MTLRGLLEFDNRWSQKIRLDGQKHPIRRFVAWLAHTGDSWYWLAVLGLIWLFGVPAWRSRSALLILGILSLAVLVLLIKFRVRRLRPEGEWGAFYRLTDPHSFPSGHAARAMMLAVLALGLGPLWFGLIVLIWAPFMALARVVMGVHYVSDIVAGMLLGGLAGGFFLLIYPLLVSIFPFLF
ncbi:MAG: phosphatase PAP2 family protein [Chloroflexi bacterium]|nr:phosphatase PAP2 family protein [Chloroflexota bacterium]